MQTSKPFAPACERNRGPILDVLKQYFPDRRRILEIGSGTGQHAVFFAPAFPNATWQTSELAENLPGLRMWLDEAALPNLPPPIVLDVTGVWPDTRFDAVFSANTLHIMPWSTVEQFFAGLSRLLEPDGLLAAYGPFNYHGTYTSQSNREFDAWLKQRSADSAIRDFEAVDRLAHAIGCQLVKDHAMPANNRLLVWRRQSTVATKLTQS
jgi:cyclopropane fatty-acyl-phospholipid synthase-like methyltransferase